MLETLIGALVALFSVVVGTWVQRNWTRKDAASDRRAELTADAFRSLIGAMAKISKASEWLQMAETAEFRDYLRRCQVESLVQAAQAKVFLGTYAPADVVQELVVATEGGFSSDRAHEAVVQIMDQIRRETRPAADAVDHDALWVLAYK